MTQFSDSFASGAFAMLLDEHGEPLTYYPLDSDKTERPICGIVDRRPISSFDTGRAFEFTIAVYDCKRTGISALELDSGGDEIGVPNRPGQTEQKMSLYDPIESTGGVLVLPCAGGGPRP